MYNTWPTPAMRGSNGKNDMKSGTGHIPETNKKHIKFASDVYEHLNSGQGLSHWQTMYIQNLEKNIT